MALYSALMPMGPGGYDEDPIYGSAYGMMNQMDAMVSSMMQNPFGSMMGGQMMGMGGQMMGMGDQMMGMGALMRQQPHQYGMVSNNMNALNLMSNPMTMMNSMMTNMDHMRGESSTQVFSSSSVMSMTTGPDGRPQVYQSSTTTRGGPGGVRETQHSVSDSSTGMRKMAIGHHIGDRVRIVEKERNKDGDEEREELVNLDDGEVNDFEEEFRRATGRHNRSAVTAGDSGSRSRNAPLAIESARSTAPSPRSYDSTAAGIGGRISTDRYNASPTASALRKDSHYDNQSSDPRYGFERSGMNRPTGIDTSNFDHHKATDRSTGLEHIEYHHPNTSYTPAPSTYMPRASAYTTASTRGGEASSSQYNGRAPYNRSAHRRPSPYQ